MIPSDMGDGRSRATGAETSAGRDPRRSAPRPKHSRECTANPTEVSIGGGWTEPHPRWHCPRQVGNHENSPSDRSDQWAIQARRCSEAGASSHARSGRPQGSGLAATRSTARRVSRYQGGGSLARDGSVKNGRTSNTEGSVQQCTCGIETNGAYRMCREFGVPIQLVMCSRGRGFVVLLVERRVARLVGRRVMSRDREHVDSSAGFGCASSIALVYLGNPRRWFLSRWKRRKTATLLIREGYEGCTQPVPRRGSNTGRRGQQSAARAGIPIPRSTGERAAASEGLHGSACAGFTR